MTTRQDRQQVADFYFNGNYYDYVAKWIADPTSVTTTAPYVKELTRIAELVASVRNTQATQAELQKLACNLYSIPFNGPWITHNNQTLDCNLQKVDAKVLNLYKFIQAIS
jgi:hypothetical protein